MSKILIVSDTWQPEINGLVTVLVNLKKELEKEGHQVVLVEPRMFKNIPVFFRPELRLALFRKKTMREIIEKENPDFIHIATESSLGLAARRICLEKNLKFTTSYHTNFAHYVELMMGFFEPVNIYLRWFHKPAVRMMVANESMRELLTGYGFKKIVLWPLGVDTEFFRRNPEARLPDGVQRPVFMYFGRVAIEKNSEDFLKCNLPGTKIIIGDGPLRLELEKKYPEAKFFGYKTGQELVDLLSICDAYVFPSHTETFGLSIIEAMACEIPVSAYNVIGPKDLVTPGVDGYLGEDLAGNAIKCLKLDKKNCRQKALQFSWETSAKSFLDNLVVKN